MTRSVSSVSARLAAGVLLAVLAVSLGACGRKSGLALPPAATPQTAAGEPVRDQNGNAITHSPGDLFAPPGEEPAPVAPAGAKKRFFLDWLLD